ncbi:MAG: hypothetical protein AAB338_00655 [Patescibacteria group bacterium]
MLSEILETIKRNIFLIFLIVLIALLSFQLGRISKTVSQPIRIEKASIQKIFNQDNPNLEIYESETKSKSRGVEKADFQVVASKKSTSGKYHFLWCPGAKQIKEENKIFFNSEKEAISAGYVLAGNCLK